MRSLPSDRKAPPLDPTCAYPRDPSDACWRLIGLTLTTWRAELRGSGLDIGRLPEHDLRRIMDAILSVARTGLPRRYLPHDFAS
ncbi:transposase [Streptomyces mirabilis]|nr:transposase [Streptomyces mirabilis]